MAESKDKSQAKSKINYETIADMGSGLIITKVAISDLREQDINARVMKTEMQQQLTANIRKRGQLESLPFCALTQDGTRIEIISGHHRIRSCKDVGLNEVFIILDVSGLNRSKIVAKQIAHNAISGFDDKSMLTELAKLIDDVDDMLESYAGKDVLEEPDEQIEKYLSPRINFDWKNILFMFLPHQITDLNNLLLAVKRSSPDYIGVSNMEEYKPFMEALTKYQNFADVRNIGTAIHAMTTAALQLMNEAGYDENMQWVQLSKIFGSSAIKKETAETISKAVEKMIKKGSIDSKNKIDFIEVMAEKYLAGD